MSTHLDRSLAYPSEISLDKTFPGHLGIQQRILPAYRGPFFEALAEACQGGLSLYAGMPGPKEAVEPARSLHLPHLTLKNNIYLFPRQILLVWQPGLKTWVEKTNPDALIVEANSRNLSLPSAIRWMKSRGRAVIGWGLGAPQFGGLLPAWHNQVRKKLLQSFDAIIAYSQRGAEEFQSAGFPPERIFVAPNAVSPRPPLLPSQSSGIDSSTRQPTVLFVGRLQARKRVDILLRACAALPVEKQPHLIIIGEGPEEERLHRLAASLYPQAEFTGARHGPDLDPYFRLADLFVLPGTGGLAVQQAMSYGLPVIVAEADGTQEDLVRPENGWRVPPGNQAALVEAINSALSDPLRLRVMGAASHRIVREEANLEKMRTVFLYTLETVTRMKTKYPTGKTR